MPEVLDAARRFTESIADALKGKIRVVSIHPAFVATDMSKCENKNKNYAYSSTIFMHATIIRASDLFTQP